MTASERDATDPCNAAPADVGGRVRPLAGATGWLISDGKAGHDVQSRGVAEALGLDYEIKRVEPRGFWRWAAPFVPVAPREAFAAPGSPFAPPWPTVAIAVGRTTIPYLRALRRRAGVATFTVVLDDPRTGAGTADLISVPEHDTLRGANVMTTLTPPHAFSPARLTALRAAMPASIAALPTPRVAVLLGGTNAVYRFDAEAEERLATGLASLAQAGASFMITPSRRTHASLAAKVAAATTGAPRVLYDGQGDNPYADFLAAADAFVVTADSVNMCGEAATTGRPMFVAMLAGGSAKFRRFHDALARHGVTRPLAGAIAAPLTSLIGWRYAPLYAADLIALEIERRVLRRRAMLGGLMAGNVGAAR